MEDLHAWIAFAQLRCLSLMQKHTLLRHYPDPNTIFELNPKELKLDLKTLKPKLGDYIDHQKLDKTLNWLSQSSTHQVATLKQDIYPKLLKQINSAPVLLYLIGDSKILAKQQIAIVGSRKSTLAGKQTAEQFASELTMSGLTITSGMALGIDSAAHLGALKHFGNTIAVLGTGVDRCYPRSNLALYNQIAEHGLILSEFELESPPKKEHFPRRNRIISGLSLGVLVVEATERSGSLITANYALQQNREVFAVPGSIQAYNSSGCLKLIQQGAKLTRSVQDILEEFREFSAAHINNSGKSQTLGSQNNNKADHEILQFITDVPVSFDKLISQSGLTIDQLCSMLLDLEMHGMIEKLPGNQFIRTAN